MYTVNPLRRACAAVLVASACAGTQAAPAGAVVVAEKREPVVVADIGTITELARQIQVEELRKKLRELRATPTKQATAVGSESGIRLSDPVSTSTPKKVSITGAQVAANTPPQVVSIVGVGSRLNARLADGRSVVQGDRISHPGGDWEVGTVSVNSVSFKRCEAGKDGAKDGAKCSTVNAHVGS